jgi:hypothetical protein
VSYAAEPYGIFANDLLLNLTGGVSRVRFRFVEEQRPFRIGAHEAVRHESIAVHGLADGAFRLFVRERDYVLGDDAEIVWLATPEGVPTADATWPDAGSDFYVSFDRVPGTHAPPALTDRNPGSITRTLAESFALELAVLSHQLELVYEAGFLATATGRDLEAIASLVGVSRRGQVHAAGEVVLSRTTPAAADVAVPAGTLVATAEPPSVVVETTATVTLRRGTLSVVAPVRAQSRGPDGVAAARTLTVLHRPILGIDAVTNPTPLTFGAGTEDDDALRQRASRALETSGRATVGAIRGALATLPGIREQDVRVEEDHVAHPGVVNVTIAAELDPATAHAASVLLEEHRPAGIRIVHSLPTPTLPPPSVGSEPNGGGDGPVPPGTVEGVWYPIAVVATVTPASTGLTDEQRQRLAGSVQSAITGAVDAVGVGEPLVYNALVAAVMSLDDVVDVVIDVAPRDAGSPPAGRRNLPGTPDTRPRLVAPDDLTVELRGALIALDVTAEVRRLGLGLGGDADAKLANTAEDIRVRLEDALLVTPDVVSPEVLRELLLATDTYEVLRIGYGAEFLDEGLRITEQDVTIDVSPEQQAWIRSVRAVDEGGTA